MTVAARYFLFPLPFLPAALPRYFFLSRLASLTGSSRSLICASVSSFFSLTSYRSPLPVL